MTDALMPLRIEAYPRPDAPDKWDFTFYDRRTGLQWGVKAFKIREKIDWSQYRIDGDIDRKFRCRFQHAEIKLTTGAQFESDDVEMTFHFPGFPVYFPSPRCLEETNGYAE